MWGCSQCLARLWDTDNDLNKSPSIRGAKCLCYMCVCICVWVLDTHTLTQTHKHTSITWVCSSRIASFCGLEAVMSVNQANGFGRGVPSYTSDGTRWAAFAESVHFFQLFRSSLSPDSCSELTAA
eukprot:GHVQ01035471.1.p2 GENE.GHVQ01035471.1~~GHVQ01035471.1.p2  ORF type:complete len:125 (-),score=13.77 GHVQ01035471.1:235-609(-)